MTWHTVKNENNIKYCINGITKQCDQLYVYPGGGASVSHWPAKHSVHFDATQIFLIIYSIMCFPDS